MNLDITPELLPGKIEITPEYAHELFDAISATGNRPKNMITFAELEGIEPAKTFRDFLKVNHMITMNEVTK